MNNMLITICARGGSKGIPDKNIKLLNGMPLIAYTIETAKNFAKINNSDVALSTDSRKIKEIAAKYGLTSEYNRPAELAMDNTGKVDVIKDLLNYYEKKNKTSYEYIIDLDVTSPLRTVEDISQAYTKLKNNLKAVNIFSVSPAKRNPYFNMVEEKNNGFFGLVKNQGAIKSRQTAPKVFEMNASIYIFKRDFFNNEYQISITDKSLVYIIPHTCFDLDDPEDFIILDIMLRENLLDFEL